MPTPPASAFERVDLQKLPSHPPISRSPLRFLQDDYLWWAKENAAIHYLSTLDASVFAAFCEAQKSQRTRPPSLLAYVARCVGKTLENDKTPIAAQLGKGLFVPHDVNVAAMVSALTPEGVSMPYVMEIAATDKRNLAEIGREMTEKARAMRRAARQNDPLLGDLSKLGRLPRGARRAVYGAICLHPRVRRYIANYASSVGITCLTPYAGSRPGWGVPLLPHSISLALGAQSLRPVALRDGTLTARESLDMTFSVDHRVLDGAPALDLFNRFAQIFESGELLNEFSPPSNP